MVLLLFGEITLFGAVVTLLVVLKSLKREAIERGFARYRPQTGEWEWLDEPEEP